MALELLWARAPQAESIATLAREYGLEQPRFSVRDDLGKCILCGLCVRVCRELVGVSALNFSKRGALRRVCTPFGEPSHSCIGCNACVAVCPTGHIRTVDKGVVRTLETWKTTLEMIACEACGQAYIPAREFEYIQAKLGKAVSVERTCPKCQRRRTVEQLQAATSGYKRPDSTTTGVTGRPR